MPSCYAFLPYSAPSLVACGRLPAESLELTHRHLGSLTGLGVPVVLRPFAPPDAGKSEHSFARGPGFV
jgi:hypothetical protein